MQRVLVDSDILSEIIKSVDRNVVERATSYVSEHSVLTFTSTTALEFLYGLHAKGALAQTERVEEVFAENDEICPTVGDYRLGAKVAGHMKRGGTPIGVIDPLIAACAINRNFLIATGNTAHFQFTKDAGFPIEFVNWRDPLN
jgi:tRNA(fMet)-specific endonuclease VapC